MSQNTKHEFQMVFDSFQNKFFSLYGSLISHGAPRSRGAPRGKCPFRPQDKAALIMDIAQQYYK